MFPIIRLERKHCLEPMELHVERLSRGSSKHCSNSCVIMPVTHPHENDSYIMYKQIFFGSKYLMGILFIFEV